MTTINTKNMVNAKKPYFYAWEKLSKLSTKQSSTTSNNLGVCLLCGVNQAEYSTREVVSKQFTDWDKQCFTNPETYRGGWCATCAWAYKDTANRKRNFVICNTEGKKILRKNAGGILQKLMLTQLSPEISVTLVGAGRKHTLPYSEWGAVSSERGVFSWGADKAELYQKMKTFNEFGINIKNISQSGVDEKFFVENRRKKDFNQKIEYLADNWEYVVNRKNTVEYWLALQIIYLNKITYKIS